MDLIIQRHLSHLGGGRFVSECPADLERNRWPVWIGMGGRFASEYAHRRAKLKNHTFRKKGCILTPLVAQSMGRQTHPESSKNSR